MSGSQKPHLAEVQHADATGGVPRGDGLWLELDQGASFFVRVPPFLLWCEMKTTFFCGLKGAPPPFFGGVFKGTPEGQPHIFLYDAS